MNVEQLATTIRLEVTPQQTLIDEPVSIQLSGLEPGQPVTLRAQTRDGNLLPWASSATFISDDQGRVDVSSQKPVEGSYDEIDPMGLFWSMTLQDKSEGSFFIKTRTTPLTITITAEVANQPVVSTRIERRFAGAGVKRIVLEGPDLVGTLFLPAEAGPHPCAILLNGSDGGMHEHSAALLASRGYAAFALAYFGVENCSKYLIKIPLEYFENAITWLKTQEGIDGERLAVIGLSRGGELALLLGATFPTIKAVVAGSPSGIVFAGLKNYRGVAESAWSYHGEPIPYFSTRQGDMNAVGFFWKVSRHEPLRLVESFQKALKKGSAEDLQKATIPVEKISGPILLISGTDDQVWPSSQFSEWVVKQLKQHSFPYPYSHLCYENAGHFVCFPYGLPSLPPWIERKLPMGMNMSTVFGGTPAINAHAASDSWHKILTFLKESL